MPSTLQPVGTLGDVARAILENKNEMREWNRCLINQMYIAWLQQ